MGAHREKTTQAGAQRVGAPRPNHTVLPPPPPSLLPPRPASSSRLRNRPRERGGEARRGELEGDGAAALPPAPSLPPALPPPPPPPPSSRRRRETERVVGEGGAPTREAGGVEGRLRAAVCCVREPTGPSFPANPVCRFTSLPQSFFRPTTVRRIQNSHSFSQSFFLRRDSGENERQETKTWCG